jgi:two-component system NtrC family sensor kinase
MSTQETGKKNARGSDSPGLSSRRHLHRFRGLACDLLTYSTRGLLRRDFLPMVSGKIREHSGCDSIELWVKEDTDKHFRCSVTGAKKMPFGFILVPCPLGEETSVLQNGIDELSMERVCCDVVKGRTDKYRPCVTDHGSFWMGAAPDGSRPVDSAPGTSPTKTWLLPDPYESVAIIPIRLEDECIGVMQLGSKTSSFFSIEDVEFYEDISAILGVALSHQYAQIELRERIKEISCLYGIARVMARPDASFDAIIQEIANMLPAAWLFPEIACARIVLNGQSYETEGFRDSPHRQVSDIIVQGREVGFVEVAYLKKRINLDEGPFLAEERSLIDNVAREVAIYYERAKAEEEKSSLQEQLRHADRLATIGQLAAGVAHELNEPLGNILGFAQLAKKSPDLPTQVQKDLKNIESASLHAREIIRKLMTFARQFPPQKSRVNLNDIVTDGIYFFEARCVKSDIQLVCRLAPDLPMITADPGQMNQVLVNLVVNAIQAMPSGGKLTVETRLTEDGVSVIVEDTGPGISDEITNQIFLPFFTTKDVNEGTGLGLAVVHGIVSSHGGQIRVETDLGKGTRFVIQLPLSDSDSRSESE